MIPASGPPTARLMIILDCVSDIDLHKNLILSDYQFSKLLQEAGIRREECFVTALVGEKVLGQDFDTLVARSKREGGAWSDADDLHGRKVRSVVTRSLARLEREISLVRPALILTLGNGAMWALTGNHSIGKWRGSLLSYNSIPLIPTYSPSYLNSLWKERIFVLSDLRKAARLSALATLDPAPKRNFIIKPDFPTAAGYLQNLLSRLDESPLTLSVDIETRGGHIACLGIAPSSTEAICIPFIFSGFRSYWPLEEESFLVSLLASILTHANVRIVGQNFIYDAQYIYRFFLFIPRLTRDTMITQHTIWSNLPKGLDVLSSLYCPDHVYWKDDGKNWDPNVGEAQLWSYNCEDCVRTFVVDEGQQRIIDSLLPSWPQLREIVNFQNSLYYPVLHAMNLGLRIDESSREEISEELRLAKEEREKFLTETVGYAINPRSPKQMQGFFYEEMAQKSVLKRSKKGSSITTDDSALDKIASREPLLLPVCKTIQEIRSLGVFRSTFVEASRDSDGRMRCSFNIAGAETYRFSSSGNAFGSGLNLQTIPKGDED